MFDRVTLINLDRRADRRGAMLAKAAGIPELAGMARFRAVHGDTVGVPGFYVSGGGAFGCRQSHTRVLEEAMLDGAESLWVLEDDCCFGRDFSGRLAALLTAVPDDWALLMLGGQHHGPPPQAVGPGVVRCSNTQRTHSYVVRGLDAMRSLYRLWMRCDTHIDHWFGQFQVRYPSYAPDPFLCGQDEGPSDIFGRDLPVRFWSNPSAAADRPVILLRAERPVAERLRALGLHYGNDRCPQTGRDKGLIGIEAAGWPADKLAAWASLICGEAAEMDGAVPCLWHDQMPILPFFRARAGRDIVEVQADTVESGVRQVPELGLAWKAGRVVWCWRGKGPELLAGLSYHKFHRGYHLDEVTGLDQGIRRVVEDGAYGSVRVLVNQLRREAETIRRGKMLLAHPDLDVARVRAGLPGETVVELAGGSLADILGSFQEAMSAL